SVEHPAYDHRAGGVVGARLRAEREVADLAGIDVVLVDQPKHRVGGHRVDALVRSGLAEAAADDGRDLLPRVAGPAAPLLERDLEGRRVHGQATDADVRRALHKRLLLQRMANYRAGDTSRGLPRRGLWGERARPLGRA